MQLAAVSPPAVGHRIKIKSQTVRILYYGLLSTLVLIILAVISYLYLFKITRVEVESEGLYTSEQVAALAGIRVGDSLFSFKDAQVKRTLLASLSYVSQIRISRSLTGTVTFRMTVDRGTMYVQLGGDYYIFNGSMLVLHRTTELTEEQLSTLTRLDITGIKKCIVGQKVVLDKPDEEEVFKKIYKVLESEELTGTITRIDVSDKFNIIMQQGAITIKCGDYTNLQEKLRFAMQIIGQLDEGTVDVSDSRLGSYVQYE